MRDRDVAPKCEAFREARRDRVPAVADKAKLHGCSFALEIELDKIFRHRPSTRSGHEQNYISRCANGSRGA
jgi:hypothetical protein